jgi:hypothetical protein
MQWVVRGRQYSGEFIRRLVHKSLIFNELRYTRRINSPLQSFNYASLTFSKEHPTV